MNTHTGGTTIAGGVLEVSDDNNLGAVEGLLSFANNATLSTLQGIISTRAVFLDVGGGTFDSQEFDSFLNGTISGPGGLTKVGDGTLTLSAINSYSGGTAIDGGVLAIFHDNNLGALEGDLSFDAGTLQTLARIRSDREITLEEGGGTFDSNGFKSSLRGTISGVGELTKIGEGRLTLFAKNSYSGGTAINGGVLAIFKNNNLGIAEGELSFNGGTLQTLAGIRSRRDITLEAGGGTFDSHGFNSKLRGPITGEGDFTKRGRGRLTLTANNTYSGDTHIRRGRLVVNGALASPHIYVGPHGHLGGTGPIAGEVINTGDVDPGNSPGTITIDGNYFQKQSGTLEIEIASTELFDRLQISGVAVLAGTLQLVPVAALELEEGDKFRFLTAAGGVFGEFTNVENPIETGTILETELVYRPNAVKLAVVRGSFLALDGLTPNQRAVASALDSASNQVKEQRLLRTLDQIQLPEVPAILDLIAPEELTAMFQIGIAHANIQSANIEQRLTEIRAGANGFSSAGLSLRDANGEVSGGTGTMSTGSDGKSMMDKAVSPPSAPSENRWGFFINGSGEFVSLDGDFNARGYDFNTGGVTFGLDYRVNDHFAVGVFAGYARSDADLFANGSVEVDSGKGGVFATLFGNGFYLNALAGAGYNSYDTDRAAFGGKARGNTNGGEFNALIGGGYDARLGGLTVGPIASLQYSSVGIDSFGERGSFSPLDIHSQSEQSLRSQLGVRASYTLPLGRGVTLTPAVRATWQHEYFDRSRGIGASFSSGAGGAFTVRGPQTGRDSVIVRAGATLQLTPSIATYANYEGELGRSRYEQHSVFGGFRVEF